MTVRTIPIQLALINDARGASLTCGHLGGVVVVVVVCCGQFFFGVRAFGCLGIVADITKSTIASSMALISDRLDIFNKFKLLIDFLKIKILSCGSACRVLRAAFRVPRSA